MGSRDGRLGKYNANKTTTQSTMDSSNISRGTSNNTSVSGNTSRHDTTINRTVLGNDSNSGNKITGEVLQKNNNNNSTLEKSNSNDLLNRVNDRANNQVNIHHVDSPASQNSNTTNSNSNTNYSNGNNVTSNYINELELSKNKYQNMENKINEVIAKLRKSSEKLNDATIAFKKNFSSDMANKKNTSLEKNVSEIKSIIKELNYKIQLDIENKIREYNNKILN